MGKYGSDKTRILAILRSDYLQLPHSFYSLFSSLKYEFDVNSLAKHTAWLNQHLIHPNNNNNNDNDDNTNNKKDIEPKESYKYLGVT